MYKEFGTEVQRGEMTSTEDPAAGHWWSAGKKIAVLRHGGLPHVLYDTVPTLYPPDMLLGQPAQKGHLTEPRSHSQPGFFLWSLMCILLSSLPPCLSFIPPCAVSEMNKEFLKGHFTALGSRIQKGNV